MVRDLKEDFDMNVFLRVVLSPGTPEDQHDRTVQKRLIDAVAAKLFWHLVAVRRLSDGSRVGDEGTLLLVFVDFPSMAVLVRAALETYAAFHFLFVGCRNEADTEQLRNLVWQLGGLKTRHGLPATEPENIAKVAAEERQIKQIEETIKSLAAFQRLSKEEKKNVLNGRWREGGWAKLLEEADIYRQGAKSLYSYLSAHCHTDYLSAMQVQSAACAAPDDRPKWSRMYVGLALVLMSHFIVDYATRFPEKRAVMAADAAGAECVRV